MEAMRALCGPDGFVTDLGPQHSAVHVRAGKTLIVTFENLDHILSQSEDRMPWGFDFIQSQGWSILGLMARGWTWYRCAHVTGFFDRLAREGFFDQFDKVVFYGASMGGYAAAAFSRACPGATVIAISPQATLDREIASWETRYHRAWRRDFSGDYGYAPTSVAKAGQMYLLYDPREPLDAMHAALFQSPNVTKLKCRFQGHRIASGLIQMKLLKPIVAGCVEGTLTPTAFYRMIRARHGLRRYQRELIGKIDLNRHPKLVAMAAQYGLDQGGGWQFRKHLKEAQGVMKKHARNRP